MFKMRIDGLDKFKRRLQQLERNAREFHGEHRVPVLELLNEEFMHRHTSFASLQAMFAAFGLSDEEFVTSDDARKDELIRSKTRFPSWQDMLKEASVEWSKKQLFK
jgi:hypothetical protein